MENSKPNPISRSIMRLRTPSVGERYSTSEYKAIFETVLLGSFGLVAALLVLLLVSYGVLHNTYVFGRIIVCGAALLYLLLTHVAWSKQHIKIASGMLVAFYYSIAIVVMFGWGVDTTFSQLMLAVTIVLSGVLLGGRAVLVITLLSIIGMIFPQVFISTGHVPFFGTQPSSTNFGDIAGFSALLMVLGIISALFDKRTRELHAEDQQANELLIKQKGTLEHRVLVRSREVEHLQLEKAEQLYKFAEVGQLSTLLLHDISNQLAVLNLDFADLKRQRKGGGTTKHIEESLFYIEDAVKQASRHLQMGQEAKEFDVLKCIESSTKLPLYREYKDSIVIAAPKKQRVLLYGEQIRLSHVLFILIRNALEAYPPKTPHEERVVSIKLEASDETMIIRVIDHGRGIPKEVADHLFNPVHSAKKGGLGIGLYIAKEITESHFNGTLRLNKNVPHTEFILTIPLKSH